MNSHARNSRSGGFTSPFKSRSKSTFINERHVLLNKTISLVKNYSICVNSNNLFFVLGSTEIEEAFANSFKTNLLDVFYSVNVFDTRDKIIGVIKNRIKACLNKVL